MQIAANRKKLRHLSGFEPVTIKTDPHFNVDGSETIILVLEMPQIFNQSSYTYIVRIPLFPCYDIFFNILNEFSLNKRGWQ